MFSIQDEKALFKLAQLQRALHIKADIKVINRILAKNGDINYAIPAGNPSRLSNTYLTGCTALHFACESRNKELLQVLLDHGADFTKAREDGLTALHVLVGTAEIPKIKVPEYPLFNLILSAHIARRNFSNPSNKDGLSHFHIACMTNNPEAVQFFLNNGISVDEPANMNSKFSPGFTPLHFAATYTSTKVVEILLAYGADMHRTDAHGKTPLHVLVERRIEMYNSLGTVNERENNSQDDSYRKWRELIEENEKIMNMILENMSSDNEGLDNIGLSNFHVACVLEDTSAAEDLADQVTDINHFVNKDSRLWPGYTALHFAAHFSLRTLEMLIKKGANIELTDAKGSTPLDICIERYEVKDISWVIYLNENWKNIIFSDGKTKLLSVLRNLADRDDFKNFKSLSKRNINMHIPLESPLWPGYTPLHLAVLFAERPGRNFYEYRKRKQAMDLQIIRICLAKGANWSMQDSRGQTPLHLAFRLNKMTVVDNILRYGEHGGKIPNVSDEDGLSHLHIICALEAKSSKLKNLAFNRRDVNAVYSGASKANIVQPGWTPLHVSLANLSDGHELDKKVTILLKYGANPHVKDVYGLTPVHWFLGRSSLYMYGNVINRLLRDSDDVVAEDYDVSYLHVACKASSCDHIKRFLENGANINLAIKDTPRSDDDPLSFLSRHAKCTPLHLFLADFGNTSNLEFLLERGVDVFAEKADGSMPLSDTEVLNVFASRLKNNPELAKRMEEEFGWTSLHVACQVSDLAQLDVFESLVKEKSAAVNAKVFSNSPVWKGYTPLHVVLFREKHSISDDEEVISSMVKILVENGADVSVIDDERNSPIGMLFSSGFGSTDKKKQIATKLMMHHKHFHINPINAQGITHFHIACYLNDVDAAERFLLQGVDVNHTIDFFSEWCPGYTPLHLASKFSMVDLLLKHGADVHIEDVDGCTALRRAVATDRFDASVITRILQCGANANAIDLQGKTPFETVISENELTMAKLAFFIEQGFSVNSCNPITGIGYISMLLENCRYIYKKGELYVEKIMMENSTTLNRSSFHHFVTTTGSSMSTHEYIIFFDKLIKSGHDIDKQDVEGKTALHLAVEFNNFSAVSALLASGADINYVDKNGMSALSHINGQRSSPLDMSTEKCLITYAYALQLFNLDLNQINANILNASPTYFRDFAHVREMLKGKTVSSEIDMGVLSMRLSDFTSEMGIVKYMSLKQSERCKVDEYIASIDSDARLKNIRCILKLQHRKAVQRLELLSSALNSLRLLLGFDLPDLCAENIFLHLCNYSLKNLIQAGIELQDMKMDVD